MNLLTFYVGKKPINVELKWTKNKNIYLKITDQNKIQVSAPIGTNLKRINTFVESNIKKFSKYIEKMQSKLMFDFETDWIYVFGKKTELKYMNGFNKNNAKISGNKVWLTLIGNSTKNKKEAINIFIKEKLALYIKKRQSYFESKMGIPQHTFKIINKTTSWGSNSLATKTISYNSNLFHYSKKVIDYVIVHELIHYWVPNHSVKFWDKVGEYIPNYKEIKKPLKALEDLE